LLRPSLKAVAFNLGPQHQGSWRVGHYTLPLEKGATGAEVTFYKNIIGYFMVFQYRIETNLLQLFAHQQNLEFFSIISVFIFEVNVVAELKEA